MPTYEIKAPDGKTYRIDGPDGASEQDVRLAVLAQHPSAASSKKQSPETFHVKKESRLAAFGAGLKTVGLNVENAIETINSYNPVQRGTELVFPSMKDVRLSAEAATDKSRSEHIKGRQEKRASGIAREGYEMAGSILASVPATFVTKNPWAALAGNGALSGALSSEAKTVGGAATDAVTGAGASVLTGGVLKGVSRLAAPKLDQVKKRLVEYGMDLTPGMLLGNGVKRVEDTLTSIPFISGFVKGGQQEARRSVAPAAVNKALEPLGVKIESGLDLHGAARAGHEAVSAAYQSVTPKLAIKIDPLFMRSLRQIDKRIGVLPDEQQSDYDRVLNLYIGGQLKGSPNLTGAKFVEIDKYLSQKARDYVGTKGPYAELGRAYTDLLDGFREMAYRQTGGDAGDYAKARLAAKGMMIVDDAVIKSKTGEYLSPSAIDVAVRKFDGSSRKGAKARGNALMQQFSEDVNKAIPSSVGDSGTATRVLTAGALGVGGYELSQDGGFTDPRFLSALALVGGAYTPAGKKLIASYVTRQPGKVSRLAGQGLNALAAPAGRIAASVSPSLLAGPQ